MQNKAIHQAILTSSLFAAICGILSLSGCQKEPVSVAAKTSGELAYDLDGAQASIPLTGLDVNLSDNPAFPETFEWTGDGVELAGVLPADIRIGYEGKWERMIGKSIALDSRSKTQISIDLLKAAKIELNPERMKEGYEHYSTVALPGKSAARVLGGSFVVEKITGKTAGLDGDRRLHGKIEIRLQHSAGEQLLKGRFTVRCATWG